MSQKFFQNKIVLLTGATGGLGKELTNQLLAKGANLILTDINLEALDDFKKSLSSEVVEQIKATIQCDLSKTEEIDTLFLRIWELTDQIDFLINNAGIAYIGGFLDIPDQKWKSILETNLIAPITITRKVLPSMLAQGSGHIINVSSIAGILAPKELGYYSISKFGLRALGESLGAEFRDRGIDVTNVYPLFSNTNIIKSEKTGYQGIKLPDFLVEDPHEVVKEILQGVEDRHEEVYPGLSSKSLNVVQKLFPSVVNTFSKLM
jgi:short-subunit dehydrogenase